MRKRNSAMEEIGRELASIANLCPCGRRVRARRGRLAVHGGRRAISRFRRRHRRQCVRPCPSAAGRGADRAGAEALAHLQPLSRPGGKPCRPAGRATFADTVFFTNSGAEACECAFKMARRYHFVSGHPERFRIITFDGAFHGRTLAAVAAGGQQKYLEGFGPKVEGFDQVPSADLEATRGDQPATGALMIEPIQGEGGVRRCRGISCAPAQAVRRARPAADLRRDPVRRRPHRQSLRL